MASKLCPACLSSLEPGALLCAQCGARLGPPRRWLPRLLLVAFVVAALAVATRWIPSSRAPAGPDPQAPAVAARAAPAPAVARHHVWLAAEAEPEARFAALALGPPGAPVLCVAAAALPLSGGLVDASGRPWSCRVLAYSVDPGFVLLTPAAPLPPGVQPLDVHRQAARAASEPALGVLTPGASGDPELAVRVVGVRDRGQLELDQAVPVASALVRDGSVRALALGGRRAAPLDKAMPWLGRRGTRALAVAQEELRQQLPEALAAELRALLAGGEVAPSAARRALVVVERLRPRLGRAEDLGALDDAELAAHRFLVRGLAADDPAAALTAARGGLLRFGGDPALLRDAAVLAAGSDPHGALDLLAQLRVRSQDHAAEVEEQLAEATVAAAGSWVDAGRLADGLALFGRAETEFVGRAAVHGAHAQALARAGQRPAALAQAELAAQLDPAFSALAHELRGQLGRQTALSTPGRARGAVRVELPIDPRTRLIRAQVTVGGERVEYVVDTGASLTTVPRAVAQRLGLLHAGLPVTRVETASSIVEAPLVVLPSLQLATLRLRRVRALVMDLPGELGGKGLLGMNVLERLSWRMDAARSVLVLESPASRRRGR